MGRAALAGRADADEPLTAESEAEKPTRARRATTRKKDEAAVGDADETVEDDTEEVEVDDEVELDDETEREDEAFEAAEAEPAEDGDAPATPKKRTRRGTRGGRNRKKKPATVAGEANGVAPRTASSRRPRPWPRATSRWPRPRRPTSCRAGVVEAAEAPAGPVIHLPDRQIGGGEEDGDGTAPPKKRTRRGSRGGKNRRKKPAGALAAGEAEASGENGSENGLQPADVVPEPATALIEPEPELVSEPEPDVEPEPEPEPEPDARA